MEDRLKVKRWFALATCAALLAAAGLLSCSDPAGQQEAETRDGPPSSFRILFGGDTYFGESYFRQRRERVGPDRAPQLRYESSMRDLAPLMRSADLVVVNLETPLSTRVIEPDACKKMACHYGDMARTPAALQAFNVQAVSLANNHAMDCGTQGMAETRAALDAQGIGYTGAGLNGAEAVAPYSREISLGNRKLPFILTAGYQSYARHDFTCPVEERTERTVYYWRNEKDLGVVRRIRRENPDALMVAFPHWGTNYRWRGSRQTALAHALIESGADLVIGHGAHMLQEIEHYQGRWIIYSLGNFVFNSWGRYKENKRDPFSLAARLDMAAEGDDVSMELRLYPILSDNLQTDFCPRHVTDEEMIQVRQLLLERSPDSEAPAPRLRPTRDELGPCFALPVAHRSNRVEGKRGQP